MKSLVAGRKPLFSGMLACLIIALVAWFLGKQLPLIGGPMIAIALGIVLSTSFAPSIERLPDAFALKPGLMFCSKKVLQCAVVLLGFDMNLLNVVRVGGESLGMILCTMACALLVAFVLGKRLRLTANTATLIGIGTAICGGSAIAASAPVIGASDEDVTRSISTIFLFNIVAVFCFPFIGRLLGLTDSAFGMWAGMAVNDTSSVVAAGTAWSQLQGNDAALALSTIVKLTRTLMIVPATLILAVYTAKKQSGVNAKQFNFIKVFPWFVFFFLLAALINTYLSPITPYGKPLANFGKFLIVVAMSAIGLNTNLKALIRNGTAPILMGFSCALTASVVALLLANH